MKPLKFKITITKKRLKTFYLKNIKTSFTTTTTCLYSLL